MIFVSPERSSERDYVITDSVRSMYVCYVVCVCMYVCGNLQIFLQNWSLYPHTLMYSHGTWTQWSVGRVPHKTSTDVGLKVIYGSMTFGSSFCKNGHCIHILWCMFRRDLWFQNHLVIHKFHIFSPIQVIAKYSSN